MKKIVCIVLCVAMLASVAVVFAGCNNVPREEQLKIYLPGEYMDYDIFEEFESYYLEKTGKRVKVMPEDFEAVEDIQREVEVRHADYDLICPSDYMVEYLIKKELLLPVDKNVLDVEQEGLFRSEYLETAREFDPQLQYAVPYMYGTLGLVYDITKTGKQIDSWEALYGTEFVNRRSLKDSIRDTYVSACIYNARNELAGLEGVQQKEAVQAIFEDASVATVNKAETLLKSVKSGSVWDVDDVKFDMAAGKSTAPAVALMWSCDAGYVMNDYEDAAGKEQDGNRNMWYVVPKEGGNVYIDAFVINKYAVNVDAANEFLAFLCRKDIALLNSKYAGAISPVKAAYDELYETYKTDDEMFEGTQPGWKEMFIETMFPSAETLNRCGVMKDFDAADYENISRMWSRLQ